MRHYSNGLHAKLVNEKPKVTLFNFNFKMIIVNFWNKISIVVSMKKQRSVYTNWYSNTGFWVRKSRSRKFNKGARVQYCLKPLLIMVFTVRLFRLRSFFNTYVSIKTVYLLQFDGYSQLNSLMNNYIMARWFSPSFMITRLLKWRCIRPMTKKHTISRLSKCRTYNHKWEWQGTLWRWGLRIC